MPHIRQIGDAARAGAGLYSPVARNPQARPSVPAAHTLIRAVASRQPWHTRSRPTLLVAVIARLQRLSRSAEGGPWRQRPPVKIKKIATAAFLPTALAGAALAVGATVAAQAAPAQPAASAAAARTYATEIQTVQQHAALATKLAAKAADQAALKAVAHARAVAAAHAKAVAAARAQHVSANPASLTAGMSAFEKCVAWRESSNTPTDPDGLFGILPSTWAQLGYSGTAGQASVAQQKVAFNRLYAEYGTQPWAPSDGC